MRVDVEMLKNGFNLTKLSHYATKLLYAITVFIYIFSLTGGQLHAISSKDISDILNGFTYYDSGDTVASCGGTSVLSGSGNEEQIYIFLTQTKGLSAIQAAGVMGNMTEESHFEPRLVEYGYKNSRGEVSKPGQPSSLDDQPPPDQPRLKDGAMKGQPGFGIVQWTGGRKTDLRNFAASAEGKGRALSDLGLQLDFLWQELTTTKAFVLKDIQAATTLEAATGPFLFKYEVPGDAQAAFPRRVSNANKVLSKYGSGTPITTSSSSNSDTTPSPDSANSCSGTGTSGVVAGNIAQTAINLAWGDKGHSGTTADKARPEYVAARSTYNSKVGNDYSDCGIFVATVMRASGADPNYPESGTVNQLPYLRGNAKYQVFEDINSVDNLKPGDILIYNVPDKSQGHTYIYVGSDGGAFNARGASQGTHVPQGSGTYFVDVDSKAHFSVARLK